jgi:iron-sulfur cluster assembly accessory protein
MDREELNVLLGVKGGGCSGFTYEWQITVDSPIGADFTAFEHGGHKFFVDFQSILYLAGMEIDYKKDIFGSTLQINNPNVTSSCGCGESFNIDPSKTA